MPAKIAAFEPSGEGGQLDSIRLRSVDIPARGILRRRARVDRVRQTPELPESDISVEISADMRHRCPPQIERIHRLRQNGPGMKKFQVLCVVVEAQNGL